MKNLKRCFLAICFALLLPLGALLTACGATPTNEVKGVFFDSNIYDDETGYAVFEVDYMVETELKFKVNPSSWSGYKPVYQVIRSGVSEENRQRFELKDGSFTITQPGFEPVTVQIILNEYTDTCIIRQKEYPTHIFLKDADGERTLEDSKYICADSSFAAHVWGEFQTSSGTEVREVKDDRYIFDVVSSNATVLQVLNPSRLQLVTLKTKPEASVVTIHLLDATGKPRCEELKLTLNVVPPISQGIIYMDGYGHYIYGDEKETIELDSRLLETYHNNRGNGFSIGFQVKLFGDTGRDNLVYVDDSLGKLDIEVTSSLQNISYDKNTGNIIVITSETMEFDLTFWFGSNTIGGTPYQIKITVKLNVNAG